MPCCKGECSDESSPCDCCNGTCYLGCLIRLKEIECSEVCYNCFGMNCSFNCTEIPCLGYSCRNETEPCVNGCEAGGKGQNCTEDEGNGSTVAIAVSAVVVVLIIITIILLIRYRRNMSSFEKKSSFTEVLVHEGTQKDPYTFVNAAYDVGSAKECSTTDVSRMKPNGHEANAEEEERKADREKERPEEAEPITLEIICSSAENQRSGREMSVTELQQRVQLITEQPALLQKEFELLPRQFLHDYKVSQKAVNIEKNRYKGYYPYDYNRVILQSYKHRGDYINASFIDGYRSEKRFIAAQGPHKTEHLEDFWRMIFQEITHIVVMLTDFFEGAKMKCLRYWPEKASKTYGGFTVSIETKTELRNYTISDLVVTGTQELERRYVKHFHYTNWPDHGVPDTANLLSFMRRVNSTPNTDTKPIVVHCSAGIGRTGTYIAVDYLMNQATTEGVVDVVSGVTKMRGQRRNMVQTRDQYLFIYNAIIDAVTNGDTSIDADIIKEMDLDRVNNITIGNRTVEEHLKVLEISKTGDKLDNCLALSSYRNRLGFILMTSAPNIQEVWIDIYNSDVRTLIILSDSEDGSPFIPGIGFFESILTDKVSLYDMELAKEDENDIDLIHIRYYHVTGSVQEINAKVLIESVLQWTSQPKFETTTIVSSSVSEPRLLVLLIDIASRLQDDGKVDVISDMRRLREQLGGPPFSLTDVQHCLEFAKRWTQKSLDTSAKQTVL